MKGFTLFFAMLVGSLALAVGLAIFDLTVRELNLSSAATQSQLAIYAADTGAECALYWDTKYTGSVGGNCTTNGGVTTCTSAFVGGTGDTAPGTGILFCNGQDIVAPSAINSNGGWAISGLSASGATTEFWISMDVTAQKPCAKVVVVKSGSPAQTTVTSHGFNTCLAGALQLERALQASY